jgi:hypothetical protein
MPWFEDFNNRLANYQRANADFRLANFAPASVVNPSPSALPVGSVGTLGLGDPSNNNLDLGAFGNSKHSDDNLWDKTKSGGSIALDILGRTGYASGGFLNDILDDTLATIDNKPHNDINPLEAAGQGWRGERKEFFHPSSTINPHHDGESFLETGGRFAGDFLASTVTDPLTWLPLGAFAKGIQTIGRIAGLDKAQALARPLVKTEQRVAESLVPDDVTGAAAAAPTPTAPTTSPLVNPNAAPPDPATILPTPNPVTITPSAAPVADAVARPPAAPPQQQVSDFINKVVGTSPLPRSEVPTTLNALKTVPYAPDDAAKNLIDHLLSRGRVDQPKGTDLAGSLYAAKAVRAKMNDALTNVKGKLFETGTFDNPWRDMEVAKNSKAVEEPVAPIAPELPQPSRPMRMQEKITQNAIVRSIPDSVAEHGDEAELLVKSALPENANKRYYAGDTDALVINGKKIGLYDIANKYSSKGLVGLREFAEKNPWAKITMFKDSNVRGVEGSVQRYDLEKYARALAGDKTVPLSEISQLSFEKMGETVDLASYAKSRREKWKNLPQTNVVHPRDQAAYDAKLAEHEATLAEYEPKRRAFVDQQLGIAQKENKRVAPTTEGRKAWIETHGNKVSDTDKKQLGNLLKRGDEAGFLAKIDEIMAREGNIDIQTVEALKSAVESGRVPMSVADDFFKQFGVRTFTEARRRVEAIDKRIAALEDKGAVLGDMVQHNAPDFSMAETLPVPHINPIELKGLKPGTPISRATMKDIVAHVSEVPTDAVTPEIYDILMNSLKETVKVEFSEGRKLNIHERNAPGAKGSTPELYGGTARYLEEYNKYSQLTYWGSVVKEAARTLPTEEGKILFGLKRGNHMYDRVMPALKMADDVMRAHGIHPAMNPKGQGIPLSIYDILSALPRKWVAKHVFNPGGTKAGKYAKDSGRQVSITQLMHFAEESLAQTPEELGAYAHEHLSHGRGLPKLTPEENLTNSAYGYAAKMGEAAYRRAERNFNKKYPGRPVLNEDVKNFRSQAANATQRYIEETLGPFASSEFKDAIAERVTTNRATAGLQAETFVKKAEYETVTKFIQAVEGVSTQSELFSMVENAGKGVAGFVKDSSPVVPPPGGVEHVKNTVEHTANTNSTTELAIKSGEGHNAAKSVNDHVKVAIKAEEANDELVEQITKGIEPQMEDYVSNMGEKSLTYRKLWKLEISPLIKTIVAFNPHAGEQAVREIWLASKNSGDYHASFFSRKLTELQRVAGTNANTSNIFEVLKKGGTQAPEDADAAALIQKILDVMFDPTGGKNGFVQKQGVNPDLINEHLGHFGINHTKFGLNGDTWQEAYQSWRNWPKHSDPNDLLSKMFHAVRRAHAEQIFGANLSHNLGLTVKHPGEDLVKIPKDVRGSRISQIIDTDRWYTRETAGHFIAMDKTLRDMAKPPTENPFWKIFDGFTRWYKSALTLPRPGHHTRNMYGDVALGYMDGVNRLSYYSNGRKILGSRPGYYDDLVLDTSVSDLRYSPENTAVSLRSPDGKHEVHLTWRDVNSLGVDQGIFSTYNNFEHLGDLETTIRNGGQRSVFDKIRRPFDSKIHDRVIRATEYRDHLPRAAHLDMLLRKDKNALRVLSPLPGENAEATMRRSLDAMFREYGTRIRKWHPDGTDQSAFEKTVMGRTMLFYPWVRKTLPRVMESMFMRPGRFLVFPKATYNLAEANGIDLNGLGDPFPSNQLFPSWMGQTQGPQFGEGPGVGGYMGIRPGIPTMDLLDAYFDSPGKASATIMSSLNPAWKFPVEWQMKTSTQTGAPITDWGKYAVGQIPLAPLANTTAGWALGHGDNPIGAPSPSNEYYDTHSDAFKDPATIAWINYFTGAGLMDFSKPSYKKSAEFDVKYGREST